MRHSAERLPAYALILALVAIVACGCVRTGFESRISAPPAEVENHGLSDEEGEFAEAASAHLLEKYGIEAQINEVELPFWSLYYGQYYYKADCSALIEGAEYEFSLYYSDSSGWEDTLLAVVNREEVEGIAVDALTAELGELGIEAFKVTYQGDGLTELGDEFDLDSDLSEYSAQLAGMGRIWVRGSASDEDTWEEAAIRLSASLAKAKVHSYAKLYVVGNAPLGFTPTVWDRQYQDSGFFGRGEAVLLEAYCVIDADKGTVDKQVIDYVNKEG